MTVTVIVDGVEVEVDEAAYEASQVSSLSDFKAYAVTLLTQRREDILDNVTVTWTPGPIANIQVGDAAYATLVATAKMLQDVELGLYPFEYDAMETPQWFISDTFAPGDYIGQSIPLADGSYTDYDITHSANHTSIATAATKYRRSLFNAAKDYWDDIDGCADNDAVLVVIADFMGAGDWPSTSIS